MGLSCQHINSGIEGWLHQLQRCQAIIDVEPFSGVMLLVAWMQDWTQQQCQYWRGPGPEVVGIDLGSDGGGLPWHTLAK